GAVLRRGHRAALRSAVSTVVPVTAHARARGPVALTSSEPCGMNLLEATMKILTYAYVAFLVVIAAAVPGGLSAQTPAPSLAKEIAASFQRASTEILDVAEAMPADKYGYKPTPQISGSGQPPVHRTGQPPPLVDP